MHRIALSSTLALGGLLAGMALGCGDNEQAPYTGGAAGSGGSGGDTGPTVKSTYYADAKPIFDAKCSGCHTEGGIAPFSIKSYETAAGYSSLIKMKVSAREMPPWPPNDDCAEYYDRRSLSQDQIDKIVKWVDDGALEGSAEEEGAPIDKGPSIALSRVDATLTMPAPYTAQKSPDDYRCFVLDWPYDTDQFVTGFGVTPGNGAVVHHVIAYLATPDQVPDAQAKDDAEEGQGYTCFGGPLLAKPSWIGAWVPGSTGQDLPAGTGIRVPAGSKVVLQVHYNSHNGGPQSDQTSIQFKIDETVEKEGHIQPWTNPQWPQNATMDIPAGDEDVVHQWAHDPTVITSGKPMTLYSGMVHMHQLGTQGTVEILRQDGSKECMLQIDDWQFHWQGAYYFTEPKPLSPGDEVSIACHWDNSAKNQPFIDGSPKVPVDVNWGEGTGDEMCLGAFYYTTP